MNSNAHEYKVNATKVALHLLREPDIFETNMKLFCAKDLEEAFIAGAQWQLQQLSHPDPPGEQGADGTIIIKEVMKEKAIEAFNEAMIYFESLDCPTAEEALKHFIASLDQGLDSGCSENRTTGKNKRIMDIFNLYFKVPIKSLEEREKVVNHLREAGFYYPDDDIDKSEVIGILVGNAYIGEMTTEVGYNDCQHQEFTVEEVLNMKFSQDHG
ncbi:hypothetical protein [Parabacteroides goldsteinii]|uniref:hypothetical protein n=1 Tax=Parabacteroides goldsteinii TaxID=328812 RepID=UPI00189F1F0A|nr:hypothetical protein [Parabacteroides goldsteinii]